jgi:hypothetical protein
MRDDWSSLMGMACPAHRQIIGSRAERKQITWLRVRANSTWKWKRTLRQQPASLLSWDLRILNRDAWVWMSRGFNVIRLAYLCIISWDSAILLFFLIQCYKISHLHALLIDKWLGETNAKFSLSNLRRLPNPSLLEGKSLLLYSVSFSTFSLCYDEACSIAPYCSHELASKWTQLQRCIG